MDDRTNVATLVELLEGLKRELNGQAKLNLALIAERNVLKAKLETLVNSCRSAETILGNMAKETGRIFGRWEIHHEPLRNDAQRMLPSFRAAITDATVN